MSSESTVRSIDQDAIVVGGSVAGLLAARVLADHFRRVTVVDRDRYPTGPEVRSGAPQAYHQHVLLARGLEIAGRFFPGISAELIAAGAIPLQWPTDALWLTPRGWSERFSPGIEVIACKREVLEWTIRRRVTAHDNVQFLEGHNVTGLLAGPERRRIAGVRAAKRSTADVQELRGDLVVDASGRSSQTPDWLSELRYERPVEVCIDAFIGYASRDYALPTSLAGSWKAILLQARPPRSVRAGSLFQVAPDCWRVSLTGAGRDFPPTDEGGFLDFARSLRHPILHDAIAQAEPAGPIRGFQKTKNQRRYYEHLRGMPENLLVTGDAASTFDPVYGQGMTAAAQSALVLDGLLRNRPDARLTRLSSRFHRGAARANAGAWLIATSEDLRFLTTEGGKRNMRNYLTHRYLDRVFRAVLEDRDAHFAFTDVIQLVAGPLALFQPKVLLPALRLGGKPDRVASGELERAMAGVAPAAIGRD